MKGKLWSLRSLFPGLIWKFDMEIKGLKDFDSIPPVEEDGKTFNIMPIKRPFRMQNF